MEYKEAVLNHFNQLVNEYEVNQFIDVDEIQYEFSHKKTGEPYIQLIYSQTATTIEIRLLGMKGVCLVKKSSKQSLSDFIHLSVEEIVNRIVYIDIQGNPEYYYSSQHSNKELSLFKIANNKELQVKLIALIAEVQLALHFSGLVYLETNSI